MEAKEFLDQTPPGGTVYGGIGPAHGAETYVAGELKVGYFNQSPIDVALRILWIQAKYPGSVNSDLLQKVYVRLEKALELSQEDAASI